jgi:hypothetical protein
VYQWSTLRDTGSRSGDLATTFSFLRKSGIQAIDLIGRKILRDDAMPGAR